MPAATRGGPSTRASVLIRLWWRKVRPHPGDSGGQRVAVQRSMCLRRSPRYNMQHSSVLDCVCRQWHAWVIVVVCGSYVCTIPWLRPRKRWGAGVIPHLRGLREHEPCQVIPPRHRSSCAVPAAPRGGPTTRASVLIPADMGTGVRRR